MRSDTPCRRRRLLSLVACHDGSELGREVIQLRGKEGEKKAKKKKNLAAGYYVSTAHAKLSNEWGGFILFLRCAAVRNAGL